MLLQLYRSRHQLYVNAPPLAKKLWKEMKKNGGYEVSSEACSRKYRNLLGTYKSIADKEGRTGQGNKRWQFYDFFSELLQNNAAMEPVSVLTADAQFSLGASAIPGSTSVSNVEHSVEISHATTSSEQNVTTKRHTTETKEEEETSAATI